MAGMATSGHLHARPAPTVQVGCASIPECIFDDGERALSRGIVCVHAKAHAASILPFCIAAASSAQATHTWSCCPALAPIARLILFFSVGVKQRSPNFRQATGTVERFPLRSSLN
jgi:hypothetical protein